MAASIISGRNLNNAVIWHNVEGPMVLIHPHPMYVCVGGWGGKASMDKNFNMAFWGLFVISWNLFNRTSAIFQFKNEDRIVLQHCTLSKSTFVGPRFAHECVSEVYHVQLRAHSALWPGQWEAMSLIWGIRSNHLRFINTPLWSMFLPSSSAFPLTHTPVNLHAVRSVCFRNSWNQNPNKSAHNQNKIHHMKFTQPTDST